MSQLLKVILFGMSVLRGDTRGKRASKAILWGVTKTTPGMIAAAATMVSVCRLSFIVMLVY
jgi:hypothetical protein